MCTILYLSKDTVSAMFQKEGKIVYTVYFILIFVQLCFMRQSVDTTINLISVRIISSVTLSSVTKSDGAEVMEIVFFLKYNNKMRIKMNGVNDWIHCCQFFAHPIKYLIYNWLCHIYVTECHLRDGADTHLRHVTELTFWMYLLLQH